MSRTIRRSVSMGRVCPRRRRLIPTLVRSAVRRLLRVELVRASVEVFRRGAVLLSLQLLLFRRELLASRTRRPLICLRGGSLGFELTHASHVTMLIGELTTFFDFPLLALAQPQIQ